MVNKQALFAYYSQSGHKDCAKYVAEICQRLLQISASHLVFEKSKWNSRKRNLISNSDCKIGFVRIPRLNLCRCTAVLLMSSWGKGFGNQQHCMQLPWSRHVKFIYFIEVMENVIASRLFMPGIFHWVCGLWAESFLVRQIFRPNLNGPKETFCLQQNLKQIQAFRKHTSFHELSWDRRLLLCSLSLSIFSFMLVELNLGLQKHWVSWVSEPTFQNQMQVFPLNSCVVVCLKFSSLQFT